MRKYLRKLKIVCLDVYHFLTTNIGLFFWDDYRMLKGDDENKLILLDLPTHENLGDHAIAISEYEFIIKKYPQKYVYRFSYNQCRFCMKRIAKLITVRDKIFLPGGGFMGTLWKRENNTVLNILSMFINNKIVIFPQTVYFDEKNIKEIEKFKTVASRNTNLIICAREKKSYDILNSLLNCNILLIPDIALSYKINEVAKSKNGKILLCFRNDKERIFNPDKLIAYFEKEKIPYEFLSTIADEKIGVNEAKKAVNRKIYDFSSYSLVICDRLHAMIFSYLGRTPCIAFDNLSKKVSGVYEWIATEDGFICIKESEFDFNQINELKNTRLEKTDLSDKFMLLYHII